MVLVVRDNKKVEVDSVSVLFVTEAGETSTEYRVSSTELKKVMRNT